MKTLNLWWKRRVKAYYTWRHTRTAAQRHRSLSGKRLNIPLLRQLRERRQARAMARKDAEVKASRIGNQRRRLLSDLARGLPAIVLSLCIASISALGFLRQRSSGTAYWLRGEQAQKREDYRAAEVYLEKAMKSAGMDRRRVALTLAQGYEQSGEMERAATIMSSLAPTSEVGFPEAHLFMAYQLALRFSTGSEVDLDAWKWHIEHAKNRGDGTLARIRADYYVAAGDMEGSLNAALEAAEKSPEILLRVAQMRAAQGNMAGAQRELKRAKAILGRNYERDPEDQQNVMSYARALVLGGEFDEALEIVTRARERKTLPVYDTFLAETRVLIANALTAQARTEGEAVNAAQLTELLLSALSLAPNNRMVIDAISVYGSTDVELRQAFREEVMRRIVGGMFDAPAFYVMGLFEWLEGRPDKAIQYTQQALDLAPEMSNAANNLAMFMLEKTPPDTDRALELINGVLAKGERDPQYYDTRAQIYAARKEYAAAITDYLKVLRATRDKDVVRLRLAELYELNGDQELAKEMRSAAETSTSETGTGE